MGKQIEKLAVDLRVGGLGDVWMRLVGFYAMAALRKNLAFSLSIPRPLESIAVHAFGDRLEIKTDPDPACITYSVRGLRDLLPKALGGQKFAAPYGRAVIKTWDRWTPRDRLNSFLYALADSGGLVFSPPWNSLSDYQGFSETILLPHLRNVSSDGFRAQVIADHDFISRRVDEFSGQFSEKLSRRTTQKVLVFPTGTGRQFIPVAWAKRNLHHAVFAIYDRDPELGEWQSSGLQTILYSSPGEIAAIGLAARVAVTTDSFPSHILQHSGTRLVILITGTERSRVVTPGFKGHVVDAVAPCHPCPHLERRGFPICKAGYQVCLNWDSAEYTRKILQLIGSIGMRGSK